MPLPADVDRFLEKNRQERHDAESRDRLNLIASWIKRRSKERPTLNRDFVVAADLVRRRLQKPRYRTLLDNVDYDNLLARFAFEDPRFLAEYGRRYGRKEGGGFLEEGVTPEDPEIRAHARTFEGYDLARFKGELDDVVSDLEERRRIQLNKRHRVNITDVSEFDLTSGPLRQSGEGKFDKLKQLSVSEAEEFARKRLAEKGLKVPRPQRRSFKSDVLAAFTGQRTVAGAAGRRLLEARKKPLGQLGGGLDNAVMDTARGAKGAFMAASTASKVLVLFLIFSGAWFFLPALLSVFVGFFEGVLLSGLNYAVIFPLNAFIAMVTNLTVTLFNATVLAVVNVIVAIVHIMVLGAIQSVTPAETHESIAVPRPQLGLEGRTTVAQINYFTVIFDFGPWKLPRPHTVFQNGTLTPNDFDFVTDARSQPRGPESPTTCKANEALQCAFAFPTLVFYKSLINGTVVRAESFQDALIPPYDATYANLKIEDDFLCRLESIGGLGSWETCAKAKLATYGA